MSRAKETKTKLMTIFNKYGLLNSIIESGIKYPLLEKDLIKFIKRENLEGFTQGVKYIIDYQRENAFTETELEVLLILSAMGHEQCKLEETDTTRLMENRLFLLNKIKKMLEKYGR